MQTNLYCNHNHLYCYLQLKQLIKYSIPMYVPLETKLVHNLSKDSLTTAGEVRYKLK